VQKYQQLTDATPSLDGDSSDFECIGGSWRDKLDVFSLPPDLGPESFDRVDVGVGSLCPACGNFHVMMRFQKPCEARRRP
jgi:hypothetical protein